MTPKQKNFVLEYVKDFNATQAATRAGYNKGNPSNNDKTGPRLLQVPEISAAIQEFINKRTEESEITVDRIVNELAKIAFSELSDAMHWTDAGMSFTDSTKLPSKIRGAISEITETITGAGGSKKLKLYDKVRALELLGKYKKMWVDTVELGPSKPLHEEIKRAIRENEGK